MWLSLIINEEDSYRQILFVRAGNHLDSCGSSQILLMLKVHQSLPQDFSKGSCSAGH